MPFLFSTHLIFSVMATRGRHKPEHQSQPDNIRIKPTFCTETIVPKSPRRDGHQNPRSPQSSSEEYKSVPRAFFRENTDPREWAHGSILLIFKVRRRRTDSGVSHQPLNDMCENLWASQEVQESFCHTPNSMLKGQYKSIQPTENNGTWWAEVFLFICFIYLEYIYI